MSRRRKDLGEGKIRLVAITLMILRGKKINSTNILHELDLKYDIQADRKTIYSDIAAIDRLIPIESTTGKGGGYQKINFSWEGAKDD